MVKETPVIKIFIFSLIVFVFSLSGCSRRHSLSDKNLDLCVKDYYVFGYFIGLTVKLDSANYKCIIRNSDLFRFYLLRNHLSQEKYEDTARLIVRKGMVVFITAEERDKFNFQIVNDSSLLKFQRKSKLDIIKEFFEPNENGSYFIKKSVPLNCWNTIVYSLFERGVLSRTQHGSGYIFLPREE